jgi:hypothetical protein
MMFSYRSKNPKVSNIFHVTASSTCGGVSGSEQVKVEAIRSLKSLTNVDPREECSWVWKESVKALRIVAPSLRNLRNLRRSRK